MTTVYLSRESLAKYLDQSRITGAVATPREINLRNIQGFLDGDQHQHMGVERTRDWTYKSVFDLMRDRVGINEDLEYTRGQDSISANLCVAALDKYADIFSEAVKDRSRLLFATAHPAGLAPVYTRLARVARKSGARVLRIDGTLPFEGGDVRQILILLGANVVITVVGSSYISWQGHLGGLLGGLAVTTALIHVPREHRKRWQWPLVGLVAVLSLVAIVVKAFQFA